jgi:endonuclease G
VVLTDFPVRWTEPQTRQTLDLLSEAVYREAEIVQVITDAGLPIAQIAFDARSDLTWRSVFNVAAGQGRVPALLDTVADARPTLRGRIEELRSDDPVVASEAPVPPEQRDPASPSWKNFSADGQTEAIIVAGQPTFVDIAFLARGIDRSRSVCRLVTRFPAGKGTGTGFRVGRDHILTNHHVLFDWEDDDAPATAVEAWFNYEDDTNGQPKQISQVPCEATSVTAEKAHDWALIRVASPIRDEFPVLSLTGTKVPATNDRVYIIQHPQGEPKKIAFQHNLVRDVGNDVIQYWTDTDLGSSGAPVFDEKWRVVALHHFSLKVAEDKMGVRNQGRLIDRVAERIRTTGELPELTP